MRITLSGDLGSGKSSVGRLLAARLGVPHFSAGTLFRKIGQISNLDALQTNLAAENNVEIDRAVDNRTLEIDRDVPSFVIDSRMAWHFVSKATRVYLSVSPRTAAKRVMADSSRHAERYVDLDSAIASLSRRRESEVRRYRTLYDVDITDAANYDLFIVTDDIDVEEIAKLIILFAEHKTLEKFWLPKQRIVPMIGIGEAGTVPDSPRIDLSASFNLPVLLAENFGFYFGAIHPLISALSFELPLVPFSHARPSFIKEDVMELAKRTISSRDLRAWEDAFRINFSFRECRPARVSP